MTDTAYERVVAALRSHVGKVSERDRGRASANCPAHDDGSPSLSVTATGDGVLLWCHAGCDTRDVVGALGLEMADLFDTRSAEYRYGDGRVVTRFYDTRGKKRFKQDGAAPTSTLYRSEALGTVSAGRTVFLVEGEKDVHAVEAAGGVATTAPQGADSFHKVDVTPLAGHVVVAVVDRDPGGDKWARAVAAKIDGVAARYRFVHAKEGKDAADHIAAGHGLADFVPHEVDLPVAEPTKLEVDIARKLHELRALDCAKELLAQEKHAQQWAPPVTYGTLADELLIPRPQVSWRIKGMLGAGHNALVIATRKAGKTTLVNHCVKCLADGGAFLGRFDTTAVDGGIAVFNYEVGAEQYRDWMRDVGIENTTKVHMLHLRGKRLPISDPRVRAWVVRWLAERDIRVWVLDPYSRAAVGSVDDGNAEMKVAGFLDHLDVIKAEAGVQELIMPAHTPKARADSGEESASGSQRLEGWPDALWYVTKDDEGARFLRAEGRDIDVAEEQLTYSEQTRGLVLGGWDRRTVAANRDGELVRAFVEKHPGCTQNAIQADMGWGAARTAKAVKSARVRREEGAGNSHLHYASTSPLGHHP